MIKKKVCMLGAFAVGKTSLVQRYVNSIFSEKYHTTIGVKIDQKMVEVGGQKVNLLLWDIHGEDNFQKVKASYLMGASGYFIVIDGTRNNTVKVGLELKQMAEKIVKNAPFIVLINKYDLLETEWELTEDDVNELKDKGMEVMFTSAKENMGVEEAFMKLTELMINQ
jgi:small GTP-binding protein